MNSLERALVEKAGRENGWENVIDSREEGVVLASARHRGRASIVAVGATAGWSLELPVGRLTREIDRTLPGLTQSAGRFNAVDLDTLLALLRRAAELSQSLPDQAAQTFREGAGFQPNRLDTLRSRTSAAYRGLYVLLQREGAMDFFWKARMVDLDRDERKIDIHHIFPRKWCEDMEHRAEGIQFDCEQDRNLLQGESDDWR